MTWRHWHLPPNFIFRANERKVDSKTQTIFYFSNVMNLLSWSWVWVPKWADPNRPNKWENREAVSKSFKTTQKLPLLKKIFLFSLSLSLFEFSFLEKEYILSSLSRNKERIHPFFLEKQKFLSLKDFFSYFPHENKVQGSYVVRKEWFSY